MLILATQKDAASNLGRFTTFAFQNWHSATELRRYFVRFIEKFNRIHKLSGVRRTKYNHYDSLVVPLRNWILDHGVDVQFATRVTDVDFFDSVGSRRATTL